MPGFEAVFVAAMLKPVKELSDDDAVVEKAVEPQMEPKKKPAMSSKPTPAPVPKAPKAKALKRPAAATEPSAAVAPPGSSSAPPMKKPAIDKTKEPKICKYLYKRDGIWGFKVDRKQVLLVPRLQPRWFSTNS